MLKQRKSAPLLPFTTGNAKPTRSKASAATVLKRWGRNMHKRWHRHPGSPAGHPS